MKSDGSDDGREYWKSRNRKLRQVRYLVRLIYDASGWTWVGRFVERDATPSSMAVWEC